MSTSTEKPLIFPTKRTAYYAPSAGRHFFSKRAAYNAEAKARLFSRCECEDGDYSTGYPGHTCEFHAEDSRYTTRRESDGSTLIGRIIKRWSALLAAHDRAVSS